MTSSAIPNTRDAKTAPYKGDAIISPETATAITPATTPNTLDHPLPCLSPIPRIIPAIPTNNSATAIRSSRKTVVPTGYDRNIDAKIITRTPRPMLPQRELLSTNIPLRTLSIPTTSNMAESITVIETTEAAG